MPIDDRDELQRMSRRQLYMEADAQGIQYPPDHPGEAMRALLRANGVTRDTMKTVKWRSVFPSEAEMQAAQHQHVATGVQHYPVRELHQSARNGVDTSAILARKVEEAAKNPRPAVKPAAGGDDLKAQNERLESLLERALTKIEELESERKGAPRRRQPPKSRTGKPYWTLYRECKRYGLPVKLGLRQDELEDMLDEYRQSVAGSERRPEEGGEN